ncbi:sugar transferase [Paenibacillus sp. GCM10012303]|uniref:sugar transferase n=1 Tax=Paenibacillus sp. GCM10012303 TaxID=3317340 RepID=UPI0036D281BD
MPQLLYEQSQAEEFPVLERIDDILKKRRLQLVFKRMFDVFFSVAGLLLTLPVLLVIAFIIKTTSKGPVFFKQIRVGQNGKFFKIYKFRTMVVDAEKKGMQITVGKDNRITKCGHFLRKTKLDELPQLINVLIGEMSFVGPRPEVPKYVELYTRNQRGILKVRPGITDYASIEYFDENKLLGESDNPEETYVKVIMVHKLLLNLKYLKRVSILEDITLIFRTLKKIVVR